MWAAGGFGRQVPTDAAASQLGEAGPAALPLLPDTMYACARSTA